MLVCSVEVKWRERDRDGEAEREGGWLVLRSHVNWRSVLTLIMAANQKPAL